jgi:hypothetical protein
MIVKKAEVDSMGHRKIIAKFELRNWGPARREGSPKDNCEFEKA